MGKLDRMLVLTRVKSTLICQLKSFVLVKVLEESAAGHVTRDNCFLLVDFARFLL